MPEQVAKRLSEYITHKGLSPDTRVFPICYSTARTFIKKLGSKLQIALSPHDLRRYSATYASRNGVPFVIHDQSQKAIYVLCSQPVIISPLK